MNKVIFHYFSGTGNSLDAAKQLGLELEKRCYDITIHSIENGLPENIEEYTLHIFVFPIYATSVPNIMMKYLWSLPLGRNCNAVVITTNGRVSTRFRDGYQGWALHQARCILRMRGYRAFLSDTLDYPHNVTVVLPAQKEQYNTAILNKASEKLSALELIIVEGRKQHRSIFLLNFLWSIPFGLLYTCFGRHFIGKLFVSDSSCSSCRLCVKKCPVKAIKFSSGKAEWKWGCEGCLRCINSCPNQAIQVSAARITILTACMIGTYFITEHFLSYYLASGVIGSALAIIAGIAIFSAVFIISDRTIFRLSSLPFFGRIIQWGHTKYFKRYLKRNIE